MSTLDLILTEISEYQPAKKLAPLSKNDHNCILLERQQFHSNYVKNGKRFITPEHQETFLSALASANWDLVSLPFAINKKMTVLHNTIVWKFTDDMLNKDQNTKAWWDT